MSIKWKQVYQFCCHHWVQLILILILAFAVRLYRIDNPVLDWHSFRQADTASVTYRYTQEEIDLLRPRYHDLSNIQSGQENPEGYRMVEFPLINGLIAAILTTFPHMDLVITSRFFSILFSILGLWALYWLIVQITDKKTALISTAFMAFMPFAIYYSRVILPEPFMLSFAILSLALFTAHLKQGRAIWWWLSCLTLSLALLLKPFVAFFAPIYFTLLFLYDPQFYKKIKVYLYPVLALAPLGAWRWWISNFPAGIPASEWLLNLDQIRFRPAWWRWLFWERLTKLIAGIGGIILAGFNLLRRDRVLAILASWWIGIFGYFVVFAAGNVRHDYYQVLALPCLAFTLGRGTVLLHEFLSNKLQAKTKFAAQISTAVIIAIAAASLSFSWSQVKGFFNINQWEYHKAGREADQLLPPDAQVIAPAHGDTMFLFQTRRNGWPIGHDISQKIEAGATHYVSTTFDQEAQELEEKHITVKKTSDYIIIDLTQKNSP